MMTDDDSRSGADVSRGSVDHVPVLLSEVLQSLSPKPGQTIVDGTFGAGGYSRALLEQGARVIAFDRDPSARATADTFSAEIGARFVFHAAPFSEMADRVNGPVDGVVLDIGVSSMQIDDPERGFSFQADGPLDMRMSAVTGDDAEGRASAADLVNALEETALANLIYNLGEEHRSRAIAKAIVRSRAEAPIQRTTELASLVAKVYGRPPRDGRHPATRTFQALRIAVNDELGELYRGLLAAESILKPGGRLVIVTFHSLEDRIVKRFFTHRAGRLPQGSRHLPQNLQFDQSTFRNVNQRPLVPGNQEIAANPRARSAKLRAGERTGAEPTALEPDTIGVPSVVLDEVSRNGRWGAG